MSVMKITQKTYKAVRESKPDQALIVTVDFEDEARLLTVDVANTTKSRTKDEYVKYLRWCADELERMKFKPE